MPASSPEALLTLSYFISVPLIVLLDRALMFKELHSTLYPTRSTKVSHVFQMSRQARLVSVVFSSICAVA